MRADSYPFQMLLFTVSGCVNRHQQDVLAYLSDSFRGSQASPEVDVEGLAGQNLPAGDLAVRFSARER